MYAGLWEKTIGVPSDKALPALSGIAAVVSVNFVCPFHVAENNANEVLLMQMTLLCRLLGAL